VSGRLGALPEKAARLLEIASTNTDRLVRLINDILDIERMESGKVTLARVATNAADLVRQAMDVVRGLADHAGIRMQVEVAQLPLIADPDRIVQTLTNLIGNAVKFSPPGSTIRVAAEEADGMVVFRVADQGRGIPPEKLEAVFERFKQVDASDSRDKGGSGLGLAICRSIVRHHGGEISVTSEVGKGSEFAFTIPTAPAPAAFLSADAVTPLERSVFICDDEEEARGVMNVLLTAHGYQVREFSSAPELLDALLVEHPDLILLDLFMPDMNGWEALARIKTNPDIAQIPVVVVSIISPEECDSPYVDLCGWLHKPLEEGQLLQAVTEALRSDARPRRLLIVEDDADLARVIASSFERYGLEVLIASTGQQAINYAATLVPDLVVLDLLLPEVDGFGVVDWIKDHDLWRGVPLVVYSALETTPSQQERLRLGPTEFITKSRIGPEEFERRVLHLLDRLTASKAPFVAKVAGVQ
jgi:CheY-like chemotaxis protein